MWLSQVATVWRLLGGAVLLAVVGINIFSVAGGVFGRLFPGVFELTEIGVAIVAFASMRYCQATGCNVTVEIFTSGA